MSITDIIVHRANSPASKTDPLSQLIYYAENGFRKLEIDIYAVSDTQYKFCHPLDRDRIDEMHHIDDGFLEHVAKQLPDVEWYLDLKCLDLDAVPLEFLQYLADAFGNAGIFIAAQPQILEFAHQAHHRTAQYFKHDTSRNLTFVPDVFIQDDAENKSYPKEKTIVYCPDSTAALAYLHDGYGGAMVDGTKLTAQ